MNTRLVGSASLVVTLLSLALAGCDEEGVDGNNDGEGAGAIGGGGEGAGPTNAGGGGGDGGGGNGPAVEPPQELFACQVPTLCSMTFHISPDPSDSPNCMAELITSGLPGAVLETYTPGPYYSVSDTLIIFRGDGTALKQSRGKSCMSCDPSTLVWSDPSDVEICDVVVPQEVVDGCEANDPEACRVIAGGTLQNCQPASVQPTCSDVPEILSAEGPACNDSVCDSGQACFDYITDMSTGTQCALMEEGCFDCECAKERCTNPETASCQLVPGGFHVSNCHFPI